MNRKLITFLVILAFLAENVEANWPWFEPETEQNNLRPIAESISGGITGVLSSGAVRSSSGGKADTVSDEIPEPADYLAYRPKPLQRCPYLSSPNPSANEVFSVLFGAENLAERFCDPNLGLAGIEIESDSANRFVFTIDLPDQTSQTMQINHFFPSGCIIGFDYNPILGQWVLKIRGRNLEGVKYFRFRQGKDRWRLTRSEKRIYPFEHYEQELLGLYKLLESENLKEAFCNPSLGLKGIEFESDSKNSLHFSITLSNGRKENMSIKHGFSSGCSFSFEFDNNIGQWRLRIEGRKGEGIKYFRFRHGRRKQTFYKKGKRAFPFVEYDKDMGPFYKLLEAKDIKVAFHNPDLGIEGMEIKNTPPYKLSFRTYLPDGTLQRMALQYNFPSGCRIKFEFDKLIKQWRIRVQSEKTGEVKYFRFKQGKKGWILKKQKGKRINPFEFYNPEHFPFGKLFEGFKNLQKTFQNPGLGIGGLEVESTIRNKFHFSIPFADEKLLNIRLHHGFASGCIIRFEYDEVINQWRLKVRNRTGKGIKYFLLKQGEKPWTLTRSSKRISPFVEYKPEYAGFYRLFRDTKNLKRTFQDPNLDLKGFEIEKAVKKKLYFSIPLPNGKTQGLVLDHGFSSGALTYFIFDETMKQWIVKVRERRGEGIKFFCLKEDAQEIFKQGGEHINLFKQLEDYQEKTDDLSILKELLQSENLKETFQNPNLDLKGREIIIKKDKVCYRSSFVITLPDGRKERIPLYHGFASGCIIRFFYDPVLKQWALKVRGRKGEKARVGKRTRPVYVRYYRFKQGKEKWKLMHHGERYSKGRKRLAAYPFQEYYPDLSPLYKLLEPESSSLKENLQNPDLGLENYEIESDSKGTLFIFMVLPDGTSKYKKVLTHGFPKGCIINFEYNEIIKEWILRVRERYGRGIKYCRFNHKGGWWTFKKDKPVFEGEGFNKSVFPLCKLLEAENLKEAICDPNFGLEGFEIKSNYRSLHFTIILPDGSRPDIIFDHAFPKGSIISFEFNRLIGQWLLRAEERHGKRVKYFRLKQKYMSGIKYQKKQIFPFEYCKPELFVFNKLFGADDLKDSFTNPHLGIDNIKIESDGKVFEYTIPFSDGKNRQVVINHGFSSGCIMSFEYDKIINQWILKLEERKGPGVKYYRFRHGKKRWSLYKKEKKFIHPFNPFKRTLSGFYLLLESDNLKETFQNPDLPLDGLEFEIDTVIYLNFIVALPDGNFQRGQIYHGFPPGAIGRFVYDTSIREWIVGIRGRDSKGGSVVKWVRLDPDISTEGEWSLKKVPQNIFRLIGADVYGRPEAGIRTTKQFLGMLKAEGLLDIAAMFQHRPTELLEILSVMLPEGRISFDELKRLMREFQKLNLQEVAAPRGFGEFDRVQVLLDTFIQKSTILARLSEIEQEVLIKIFLRYTYKRFSKDPKGELAKFNQRLKDTENPFLLRLRERVNEEYQKAINAKFSHIKSGYLTLHQKIGAYRLRQNRRFGLLDGTRAAKTRQALAALNPDGRTLIISPAHLIDTWLEEEGCCLSEKLNYKYFSLEGSREEREEVIREAGEWKGYAIVVLRGEAGERKRLLEAVRNKKKFIIHVSMETLRDMSDEDIALLTESLDTGIIDEWHYVDHFFAQGGPGAQQAAAVQKISPPTKWLLGATPYRNRPYQLFSFFHYIYGGLPDCPEWAKEGNARVFKKTFTEDMTGFRLLSGELARASLRRSPEDVWELYNPDLPAEEQPLAIPHLKETDPAEAGGYTITEDMAEAALKMIENFGAYIADVYNPSVSPTQRVGKRFISIINKLYFLRWLMVSCDAKRVGISSDSPFWAELDKIVKKRIKEGKKIILYAQNTFMINELLRRYGNYGCVRIDGRVQDWARDENGKIITGRYDKDKRFHRGEGTTPITAKSWMRQRFQYDDKIQICAANIRAGVGQDLSRADVEIYVQLPLTYVELYHSVARAFGVNPHHVRESVEVIYMVGSYPKSILKKYKDSKKYSRYLESGTVDEIQLRRLGAHRNLFDIIMENVDISGLDEEGLRLLPRIPGFLEDPSLDAGGLRPRLKQAAETVMCLGAICAIATPPQREAIRVLLRDAYNIKADLRPLGQAISAIEDFKPDDLITISKVCEMPSLVHKQMVFKQLPEVLINLYNMGMSLKEFRSIWDGSIPDHILISWLIATPPGEEPSSDSLVGMLIEECRHAINYRPYLFQLLSESLIVLGYQNIDLIENQRKILENSRISLKRRIMLIKRVSEIARLSSQRERLGKELVEVGNNFKELENKVEAIYFDFLSKGLERDIGIKVTKESLKELEARWGSLDDIFLFIDTLKKGRRMAQLSRNKRLRALYERDLRRFGEILGRIIEGDYPQWRNEQKGKRAAGYFVDYLKTKEDFWRKWTRQEIINLGNVKVEPEKFLVQSHQAISSVIKEIAENKHSQAFNNIVAAEGEWVANRIRDFILSKDKPKSYISYKNEQKDLSSLYNRLIKGDMLIERDGNFLRNKADIDPDMELPDIIDALQDRLQEYSRVEDWFRLILWAEMPSSAQLMQIKRNLQRIVSRLNIAEGTGFISGHFGKALSSLKGYKQEARVYEDTEVIITSDPQLILDRGMLDPQLYNRFQLEGEPEIVASLIDDLASRNKMLVLVKSRDRVVAVAMAKIRRTEKGKPAIFLEQIFARIDLTEGHYDFRNEMLAALRRKAELMNPHPICATLRRADDQSPMALYSTGGYGEREYSESLHGLRTIHIGKKNYDFAHDASVDSTHNPSARKDVAPIFLPHQQKIDITIATAA